MERRKRKKYGIVLLMIVVAVPAVSCIVYSIFGYQEHKKDRSQKVEMWNEGWEHHGEELTLPASVKYDERDSAAVTKRLGRTDRGLRSIAFYTYQQKAEVYINDKLIYKYDTSTHNSLLKVPANQWCFVRIPKNSAGKTITVRLSSPYNYGHCKISTFYIGQQSNIEQYLFSNELPELLINIIVLIMGTFLLLFFLSLKFYRYEYVPAFYLGLTLLYMGFWMTANMEIPFKIYGILQQSLNYTTVLILPIVFIKYLQTRMENKQKVILGIFEKAFIANFFTVTILQFSYLADYEMTILSLHILVSITLIYLGLGQIKVWKPVKLPRKMRSIYYIKKAAFMFLLMMAILELWIFYGDVWMYNGIYLNIGILIYTAAMLVYTVAEFIEGERKNAEVKKELLERRVTMLMSQMKPHFLYNTLQTIQELCYTQPETAASAIVKFSKCLRRNMDLLGEQRWIPFTQELDYIKNYMEIEKLRFGKELEFLEEIDVQDFSVPAFLIQPLIENAVKHGVRKKGSEGYVKLKTWFAEGYILIEIQDNGVGISEGYDIYTEGHALYNIQKRLESYPGICLEINSRTGEGTQAFIVIEREKEYESSGGR